jgi:histidine triad (HIT) family protein
MTIFERIASREIPARIVHEADNWMAFHDANPQAPVHVLVIPKRSIPRLDQTTPADAALLGEMLQAIPELARRLGLAESGYRVVINNGRDAGESVPHLHIHLLGGRALKWPPG